ncbi:MAG: hypothetical protein HKN68_18620 [Saprospiraceae bacterium]|nr:hypothetical protein [Saprospiraceae bacterium]
MKKLSYLLCMVVFLACNAKEDSVSFSDEKVQKVYTQYKAEPNEQNARLFCASAIQAIGTNTNMVDRKKLIDKGLEIANENNVTSAKSTFLINLIRDYEGNKETPDRIYELAEMLKASNKEAAANTLFHSFAIRFKNHPKAQEAKNNLSTEIQDIDKYILEIGEKIFENADETGVNKANSQYYVDACEAYALANPNSVASPDFLYRAAEIARTLRTFPKALSLYDWIINKYPEYEKAPTVLFLKGFLLENEFNDIELAKNTYKQFIDKYPRHELTDDVTFLYENIGKSDEEIMKMIEANKEKSEVQ